MYSTKGKIDHLDEYNELIHKKIHEGYYYSINTIGNLSAGASRILVFKTPVDKYIHLTLPNIEVDAGRLLIEIFANPVIQNQGTPIRISNHNANSSVVSGITYIQLGNTLSSNGVTLFNSYVFGGNKIPGTNIPIREEFILTPDTMFALKLTNEHNVSQYYSHYQSWYETLENYR